MAESDHRAAVSRLEAALASGDLPGPPAQDVMSSRPPRPDRETDMTKIPPGTRHAGVLVLLYPDRARAGEADVGATSVVLTLRTETTGLHSRQISFPGGALEEGETPTEGALREASEEVNLEPGSVEVLGALTPLHIPVSAFLAHPVVAVAPEPPLLAAEPTEVAAILEAQLHELMEPGSTEWTWIERPRGRLLIPYFSVSGTRVWGATAMMLAELLAILGWDGPSELVAM